MKGGVVFYAFISGGAHPGGTTSPSMPQPCPAFPFPTAAGAPPCPRRDGGAGVVTPAVTAGRAGPGTASAELPAPPGPGRRSPGPGGVTFMGGRERAALPGAC